MSLHDLPAKWRDETGFLSVAYRKCADELEAALAGGGEAVAQLTTYEDTNSFSARMHDVVHDLPAGTYNLYIHPAGSVQVTDEDIHWLRDVLEMLNEAGGPTNKMRAVAVNRAINALNPGGSRE